MTNHQSKIEKLITELCPNGVEFVPLWKVTTWDKRFNAVERAKQPQVISYPYLLAADLFSLKQDDGDIFLLSTGEQTGWTTEELAGENLREGEVVTIPWGKSRPVKEVIKYYKGRFVTADNRIATSNDTDKLLNKFLYYWMISQGEVIDTFYRGSGIKHPSMVAVLDMSIPIPPLPIQQEIVKILDTFTTLEAELEAELEARKKQYEYYREELLTFGDDVERKTLGDVGSIRSGKNQIRNNEGMYPVYGSTGTIGYSDSFAYEGDLLLVARVGAYAGLVNKVSGKFDVSDNTLMIKLDAKMNFGYIYHLLISMNLNQYASGGGQPLVTATKIKSLSIPIPPLAEQERIVAILDKFDALVNDISVGLPAELNARRKQYEYYRGKLLTFKPLEKGYAKQ